MLKKYCLLILATISISVCASAQTLIKGKVTSEAGEALIGANVVIKGTSNGTVTDINGDFSLQVPVGSENGSITISSIGYLTKEIVINGQTTFSVQLAEDLKVLNEVVVTGYQSQRKDKITGAVALVDPEDLVKLPVYSLDQALQGRAPGVVVSQNTGAPGEGSSVRIRGVGSIYSNNSPLYVVDGLPTLDINQISPQDVKSMTVLKDASAAAVYGARAANGVIIVTTKSGAAEGKMQVSVNSQVGFQEPSRKIKMANTQQYVQIFNEAADNDNATKTNPIFFRKKITEDIASNLANTDWIDAIMRQGIIQTHNVAVSGGDEKTRYYVAGNFFGQDGIVKASDYQRLSGRVNVESDVKSWLRVGANLNLSRATTDFVGSSGDGAGGNGGSVIRYAYFRSPAIPVYDDNGNFTDKPTRYDLFGDGYNPVGMLAYNQNKKKEDRIFGRFFLNIEPIKGLKFITNFGFDVSNANQRRFDRTWGTDGRINGINRLKVTQYKLQTITWSNYATYTKTFDQHTLTFLAGEETVKGSSYVIDASQSNFPDQDPSLVYLGAGQGIIVNSEHPEGNALASFFGKVDYDFANKYIASATIRRDGSSRFGQDNRWGTFYAGSLGWRVDQEFFKDNDVFDRWLVRAGYGVIGNQEIPQNYGYASTISLSSYYPYGSTRTMGSAISSYGNSTIQWESSKQLNIGTDIELWSGKLTASVDYYHKKTTKALLPQQLAASLGLNPVTTANTGDVLNEGIELALGHEHTIGDFHYSVNVNGAVNRNIVLTLTTGPLAMGAVGTNFLTQTAVGHPIGSFYLLEMEGIFQNAGQIFTHAYQGSSIKPGDVMFKDQNNTGTIDSKDRQFLGSNIPKFTSGLNISMSYKSIDLSLFFQGAYGQKVFSVLNRDIEGFYRAFNVTEDYFLNHWTGEGTTNKYPRASWDGSGNNNQFSSRYLYDASYTRLKNMQIGYNVPKEFASRYGFNSFRIYVSGTNLFTFTKFPGADPEMTVSDNAKGTTPGDLANGLDWGTYPAARSYSVGVNVTF